MKMRTAIAWGLSAWVSVTLAENFDMMRGHHHRRGHPPETWTGPTPTPTPIFGGGSPSPSPSSSPSPSATPVASATPTPTPEATPGSIGPAQPPPVGSFGGSLPGLTAAQTQQFLAGRSQFQHVQAIGADAPGESGSEGLGPIFNNQSCAGCHTQPLTDAGITVGGASAITETRFVNAGGVSDVLHQACLVPFVQDVVPLDSVVVAHRKSIDLFGRGLIEAIPDQTIIANVHNPPVDGVMGRPALLQDLNTMLIFNLGLSPNLIGRFGWKAQIASLLDFSGNAYIVEIGVTNRFNRFDLPPHVPDGMALLIAAEPDGLMVDTLQDTPTDPAIPEDPIKNPDDIDRFHDFMQLLGPPPVLPLSAQAQRGQAIFTQINCVACHKSSMTTGANPIAALAFQNVPLFSDLLLHDMGTLGDGIPQAGAGPTEMKTAPLWGLRARAPFLHDGRAATVQDAIEAHDAPGAESQTIAQRFKALGTTDQQALIAYLLSI